MNRVHTLSSWLKRACIAGFVALALVVLKGLVFTDYQVSRVIWFFKLDQSWLVQWIPLKGRPLMWTALVIWGLLWTGILVACWRIFDSCSRGEAFRSSAIRGFRELAGVMLTYFPMACLFCPATRRAWMVWLAGKMVYLLIGFALLLLAWVMDDARCLQDEQDLVV